MTTMFLEEMIAPFAGDGGDDDDRPKTPKLLDVGCGCGGGAIEAAKAGFDVTAIDSSPAFIGRLSERCEQSKSLSIRFEVACFCSTDNPDDEPEHVIPAWSWPKGYDRVGYLDFGVNAKRLNYLAKALREKGWNAEGVDLKV